MRKEHTQTEQSYIDWLKSLGCVFYAPLTEGDTTDHISGQQLIMSNGTFTWNRNKQAYQFNGPGSIKQYIASWNNLDMDLDVNNFGGSWMWETCIVNASALSPYTFGGRQFAQAVTINDQGYAWRKWATTLDKSDGVTHRLQFWYFDGIVVSSYPNGYDRGVAPTVLTNEAKIRVECNNVGTIWGYTQAQYCMRNAMIFNTVLTNDQIRQVQQIS